MGRTLNLVNHLLTTGRRLQELGRAQDALRLFGRLASFRELPAAVAEEVQSRLAGLELRRRKYHRARRHLAAAIAHQPDSAHYHYLMATAVDDDAKADPQRACDHYRRSLELEPDQAECLGDFGLLAVALGETDEGLAALRRAVELVPNDPNTLAKLVEGLCEAGRADEARQVLRVARFRNPRDGRFGKLWNDFQFRQVREEQEAARRARRVGEEDRPTILPFVPPEESPRTLGGKRIRRDGPAPLPGPHLPKSLRLSDRRYA